MTYTATHMHVGSLTLDFCLHVPATSILLLFRNGFSHCFIFTVSLTHGKNDGSKHTASDSQFHSPTKAYNLKHHLPQICI